MPMWGRPPQLSRREARRPGHTTWILRGATLSVLREVRGLNDPNRPATLPRPPSRAAS